MRLPIERGTYGDIAHEYYDAVRHPTSSNFRTASARVIDSWLDPALPRQGQIIDVGAGDSLVGELLHHRRRSLRRLTLLDASPEMLRHSQKWLALGATAITADARTLPLPDSSVGLLVASLGDAFNERPFWQHVQRVLRADGIAIYTTPSYEWASKYREEHDEPIDAAEFLTREEKRLLVPSFVLAEQEQVRLFASVGLETHVVQHVLLAALEEMLLSPKLSGLGDLPVVIGYLLKRP
jgi:SAM-dependent methyltransferase